MQIRGPLNSVITVSFLEEDYGKDEVVKESMSKFATQFLLAGGEHKEFLHIASECLLDCADKLCDGNKAKMAELLGITRTYIYQLREKNKGTK